MDHRPDLGFRELIGRPELYKEDLYSIFEGADARTIYRVVDRFSMHYFCFWIPGQNTPERMAVAGPYFDKAVTHEELLEYNEKGHLPLNLMSRIEKALSMVPVFTDAAPIVNAVETLYDIIWGSGNYKSVDSIYEHNPIDSDIYDIDITPRDDNPELEMHALEMRYKHENALMEAVEHGHIHKAKALLQAFNELSFEHRVTDPLRNMKNYCVITNTILRKAAERGGLHPYYLDKISSAMARKIEATSSVDGLTSLIQEMIIEYCKMVHNFTTKNYSKVVQDTVLYINTNLMADLSLSALAQIRHINPSYLSSLFKAEVGLTVTEYATNRRIQHAKHLLASSRLQIQTIAQHCGISDVNYFSKVFKKVTGTTPRDYRNSLL